jgi:hypothetical protein
MERKLICLYCVLLIVFMMLNAGPILLHAIEYQRVEVEKEKATAAPSSAPAPTPTYTLDEAGDKHWVVTVTLQLQLSTSLTVVRHVYVFGMLADSLQVLGAFLDMGREIANSIVMLNATMLLLFRQKFSTTISL